MKQILLKAVHFLGALFTVGCSSAPIYEMRHTTYQGDPCPLIAAGDNWVTISDNPRWGDAFIASMLGEKNLSGYVYGGTKVTSTKRDINDNLYRVTKNELNEIVQIIDLKSGCPIGKRETARKRILFE